MARRAAARPLGEDAAAAVGVGERCLRADGLRRRSAGWSGARAFHVDAGSVRPGNRRAGVGDRPRRESCGAGVDDRRDRGAPAFGGPGGGRVGRGGDVRRRDLRCAEAAGGGCPPAAGRAGRSSHRCDGVGGYGGAGRGSDPHVCAGGCRWCHAEPVGGSGAGRLVADEPLGGGRPVGRPDGAAAAWVARFGGHDAVDDAG